METDNFHILKTSVRLKNVSKEKVQCHTCVPITMHVVRFWRIWYLVYTNRMQKSKGFSW